MVLVGIIAFVVVSVYLIGFITAFHDLEPTENANLGTAHVLNFSAILRLAINVAFQGRSSRHQDHTNKELTC